MIHLIYRQFIYDPAKTFFTCLAVATVIGLILLLGGFQQGLYEQLRATVLNRGADLILAQSGVANFIATRSIIPQLSRLDVESVEGVKNAYPLTSISAIYRKNGRKNPVYIFVYDNKGGPTSLVDGGYIDEPREIIIDRALASIYDLSIGDPFVLTDFRFNVAGISKNSAAFFTPFAYIKFDDLIDFYIESDIAADITTFPLLSYLLVELEENADLNKVAKSIENNISDVDVFKPETLAENDVRLGRELFGPVLNLLLLIGYIIGLLAVCIIMFSIIHARKRSLAVIRALGFSNTGTAMLVAMETAILILMAFPFGMLIAWLTGSFISWVAPLYLVLPLETYVLIRTFFACVVLSILGAMLAMYLVSRIEPGIAFKD